MEEFGFIVLIIYVIGIWIVYQAGKARAMQTWESIVASVVLTPLGGLLYCLCFPSKEEKEISEAIKLIHDKMNKKN